jgi:hypothetical protein
VSPDSDPDARDDALSWAGDETEARPPRGRAQRARDATASGAGRTGDTGGTGGPGDTDGADDTRNGADHSAATGGSALLVFYGILAGVYLLYMVGWLISIVRNPFSIDNLFAEIVSQFGEFLAIASPLVWFFVALVLTRGRRPSLRVAWLIAGAILLVPWPFVLGVN